MRTLGTLLDECLQADYLHVHGASYALAFEKECLNVYFQDSNGWEDWRRNLAFPIKRHRDLFVHGGFLESFLYLEEILLSAIDAFSPAAVVSVGYSHGGALATLFHECIFVRRPDLGPKTQTIVYGCPRVFAEPISESVHRRFGRLIRVENEGDPVTALPPRALRFSHVGRVIAVRDEEKKGLFDAHRAQSYQRAIALLGF